MYKIRKLIDDGLNIDKLNDKIRDDIETIKYLSKDFKNEIIMNKINLTTEHLIIIDALSKTLKQRKSEVLYDILEMGFGMFLLATESEDKIKQAYDILKNQKAFMKYVKLLREFWDAGQQNPTYSGMSSK